MLVWLMTPILKLSKPLVRKQAKVEAKATVRSLEDEVEAGGTNKL